MKKQFLYYMILAVVLCACAKDGNQQPLAADNGSGGKGGSMARFAIVNNYLYVVNQQSLRVFDISSPLKTEYKTTVHLGWDIETIFPYNNNLFIGSSSAMFIVNINDPLKPKLETRVSHFRSCDPVVSEGNAAYVTLRVGSSCGGTQSVLQTYDVTDVKAPVLKNQQEVESPYGLGIQGNTLYVCNGTKGLRVYDITNRFNPRQVRVLESDSACLDVIPYNDVLIVYVKGGVRFYDISTPPKPALLSEMLN